MAESLMGQKVYMAVRHDVGEDRDWMDLRTAQNSVDKARLAASDINRRSPGYYVLRPVVGVALAEVTGVYYDDRT